MLLAILTLSFVTILFGCLGICIANEVKGRQKIWAWLITIAGWVAIVAYVANIMGLWGKTFDPSAPIPDWFMAPFCALFFTLPITFPLLLGIYEIWHDGGRDAEFSLPFHDDETGVGFLYAVSLGLSFYLTDLFGIHYGWSFLISLPMLLIVFFVGAVIAWSIWWINTQLARQFSPAARRARTLKPR